MRRLPGSWILPGPGFTRRDNRGRQNVSDVPAVARAAGGRVVCTKQPMSLLPRRSRHSRAARRPSPESCDAERRGRAQAAFTTFAQVNDAILPRAGKEITEGQGELVVFWDIPTVLWVPLRTTVPMESSAFLTVGLGTVVEVDGGPGSCTAALAMGFKGFRGCTSSRGPPGRGSDAAWVGGQADVRFLPFRVSCGSIKHACGTGPWRRPHTASRTQHSPSRMQCSP